MYVRRAETQNKARDVKSIPMRARHVGLFGSKISGEPGRLRFLNKDMPHGDFLIFPRK